MEYPTPKRVKEALEAGREIIADRLHKEHVVHPIGIAIAFVGLNPEDTLTTAGCERLRGRNMLYASIAYGDLTPEMAKLWDVIRRAGFVPCLINASFVEPMHTGMHLAIQAAT